MSDLCPGTKTKASGSAAMQALQAVPSQRPSSAVLLAYCPMPLRRAQGQSTSSDTKMNRSVSTQPEAQHWLYWLNTPALARSDYSNARRKLSVSRMTALISSQYANWRCRGAMRSKMWWRRLQGSTKVPLKLTWHGRFPLPGMVQDISAILKLLLSGFK